MLNFLRVFPSSSALQLLVLLLVFLDRNQRQCFWRLGEASSGRAFLGRQWSTIARQNRSALFSKQLSLSRLTKQLAGEDALLLFCSFNSTTVLLWQDKLLCSSNKPGGTTHDCLHIRLSPSLIEGTFSWQRGVCSS